MKCCYFGGVRVNLRTKPKSTLAARPPKASLLRHNLTKAFRNKTRCFLFPFKHCLRSLKPNGKISAQTGNFQLQLFDNLKTTLSLIFRRCLEILTRFKNCCIVKKTETEISSTFSGTFRLINPSTHACIHYINFF